MNQENKREPVYFLHSGIPHLFRFTPTLCTDEWNVFMYTWKWELCHPAVIAYGSIREWEHDTNQPVVAILKEKKVVYYLRSGKNYVYRAWETPDDFYRWVMVDVWLNGVWSGIRAFDDWEEWERNAGPEITAIIHKRGKLST